MNRIFLGILCGIAFGIADLSWLSTARLLYTSGVFSRSSAALRLAHLPTFRIHRAAPGAIVDLLAYAKMAARRAVVISS